MSKFRQRYDELRGNKWLRYFAVVCRVLLALGFIPSGIVKIMGERFTALPNNHPLGHFLEALHHTGFYYPMIGYAQLSIALLLLIPRTALLGAMFYFPMILNICVLAYATRFEGTRITTFMLLANLFLLVWDYDRLKSLVTGMKEVRASKPVTNTKFPFAFFGFVIATLAFVVIVNQYMFNVRPGNMKLECTNACKDNANPEACYKFCDCIYEQGGTLEKCLEEYEGGK